MDLIDLTDDAEYVPSSSSTAVAASQAPLPLLGMPAHFHTHTHAHSAANGGHTAPPFHPTAAMSSFGNYNLMDFLSDEEDDEDYEPPRFDEDAELDDDRSDLSEEEEETSPVNEVIELPDSDEEGAVRSSAPVGVASSARLSGIMVWCHECDSYHDKQRVYDDAGYCPTTYASLVSTGGFSDIRQDRTGTSSSGSAASGASRCEAVAHPPLVGSRVPLVGSVYSVRVVEETEWTSDDSTTSGQWRGRSSASSGRRSSASAAHAYATSSAGDEEEAEFEAESDLARTMSDATTASSRSRASQVATQAKLAEARTQCSDGDGELAHAVTSAATTQSSSSSDGAKTSSKRANWLAYLEEEEEEAEARDKRRRTESSGGVGHQEF